MEVKLLKKETTMKMNKSIRTFSLLLTTFSLALCAYAVPSYVLVNTMGAKDEQTASQASYSGYYCTKAAAAEIFGKGNDTYEKITAYLTKDEATYQKGMSDLATKGGVALNYYGFDDGEYSFIKDVQSLEAGEYLAILAYAGVGTEKDMIRVFSSTAVDGALLFAPGETGGGKAGDWATVPEPTSGLLSLFALAALALKRRRA